MKSLISLPAATFALLCLTLPATSIFPAQAIATENTLQVEVPFGIRHYDIGQTKNFTLPDIDGEEFELNSTRGKWVFLHFWASWCGPCREEFPLMVETYEQYADDALEILGVLHDDLVDSGGTRRRMHQVAAALRFNRIDTFAQAPVGFDRIAQIIDEGAYTALETHQYSARPGLFFAFGHHAAEQAAVFLLEADDEGKRSVDRDLGRGRGIDSGNHRIEKYVGKALANPAVTELL